MSRKKSKDRAASIRQRLLNLARANEEDFLFTLTRFGIERLMYRLSESKYADNFVLKGATLYLVWSEKMYRATRDLDLLAIGESSLEEMVDIFRDVCTVKSEDDGLAYQTGTVRGIEIREEQEYNGVRITLEAKLGEARIPLQVDIGFGDIIIPAPRKIDFPSMLDLPSPRMNAYPPEAVIAEKLQAMVMLGMKNSRMKDFYDLWYLAKYFSFKGSLLCRAIKSTFNRRKTALSEGTPLALTPEFSEDSIKKQQWKAFLERSHLNDHKMELCDIAKSLSTFLLPPTEALRLKQPFQKVWEPGGPWKRKRVQ